MKTSDFDYELPPEFIAQTPIEPRDTSRLLVLDRQTGEIEHAVFRDLGSFLNPGDLLVLNETRVIPARLFAKKLPGGGRIELLLLRRLDEITWEVLVGGQGMKVGRRFALDNGAVEAQGVSLQGEVIEVLDGPRRLVRFDQPIEASLPRLGHVPLPPYIHAPLMDPERYQTVYARTPGSAAAPTAGLHFTPQLIERLKTQGIRFTTVTLHVGLDTFAPVTEDNPADHQIHTEWCRVSPEAAQVIQDVKQAGRRVIAVGTTSVRTLESAAQAPVVDEAGEIQPYSSSTGLFILPGYNFKMVDAMITNFHLPRSTLIMLVSSFAGREHVLNAYQVAKREGYRFYSFGDAMLIR